MPYANGMVLAWAGFTRALWRGGGVRTGPGVVLLRWEVDPGPCREAVDGVALPVVRSDPQRVQAFEALWRRRWGGGIVSEEANRQSFSHCNHEQVPLEGR